ncbi:ARF GTPase activator [Cordyceps fumosorosea ARSEF 2679]|uniref:ADP-ribosylation factor GTPase-activating protein n=1 Tax=Cordyceps fumosorosea (strain ARSEF 2679) TaxID=1081104 RepID=A0A162LQ34_CORFA|nr:ARF GTPase activator [Cordyceps fumosorosea ARSEF 2679]OAA73984.1 ARF GTPase activator [Cordyceps fumosorosea ARSEF 2679]
MGNITSKPDDQAAALYLRDQNRLTISSLIVTNPRKRTSVHVTPNTFPATRLAVIRTSGEQAPVEFVQDPEPGASGFLLKLDSDDELIFTFTFVLRQPSATQPTSPPPDATTATPDTSISGLTFVCGSTSREVENLVTREFLANPNLHKNDNVALVGDYSTSGSSSVTFEWTWKWKPPKPVEDKIGGWRNFCSFVEYDSRAHRLHALASFSFWVASSPVSPAYTSQPNSPNPGFLLGSPPKIRVASAQSVDSRLHSDIDEVPLSPLPGALETFSPSILPQVQEPVKVDVSCPRPGEDVSVSDDGPVFRATLKALEQKTGNMRIHMKRVLKSAEHAHTCQLVANEALVAFMDALREASSTNAHAVQPALEHYFDKIAREILSYDRQNTANLQKIIIEPINKLYQLDIKQAEAKKRDFEDESKEYYAYVSRYLGQRHDSVKAKKLADSDSKYQNKRRNFELKRFDYSSFMQDLHGGRKEQEVLSHLTKYADAQTKGFLATAKKIEALLPQLDALSSEVSEADKEYQYQRREREEKRRLLEKSNTPYLEPEQASLAAVPPPTASSNGNTGHNSDSEIGRADSTGSQLRSTSSGGQVSISGVEVVNPQGGLPTTIGSPSQNTKFKGFRDLEEPNPSQSSVPHRKEGLLWALNRPGGHVDPRNLNKQGWHKFWIVLDQGQLLEYSNWKQKLDLHMDPIDLRMASVREARNAERRFCFEVITPNFKRVYQATSGEDMNSWIVSINNALQSAVEGRSGRERYAAPANTSHDSSIKRDIGSILTGKTQALMHSSSHSHGSSSSGIPFRRITVGARPAPVRTHSAGYDENPDQLLQMLRDNDQGNNWCADCGSGSKVEWVSINLGIILCIECSGIHRSLGTHISKVRSLTLDIKSFTVDIVELLVLIGNRVSNMVWEATLDPTTKLAPQATREVRLKFITNKYVNRSYVQPISSTLSHYATPDETLLAAIKKNEIQQVLYALALKANPNAVDRMRGTHAVWLALAAADPASPSPTPGATADKEGKQVPFPVAELLTQNGAEIPATPPAFPLGRFAQLYVQQKQGKTRAGVRDSVQVLPNSGCEVERTRSDTAKLQKRISAGGRLARSPIPEK